MKLLIVQNTDWLLRNPAHQHHLAEMMQLRGHQVRAIDFELLWKKKGKKGFYSRRQVFENVSKIYAGAKITVIRPGIIKLPIMDYISLWFSQRREVIRQIKEFQPDVIVALGITANISGRSAKKYKIPFVYYWIDVSHRLVPLKFLEPIGWFIERNTLRLSDKVLTINEKLSDYVVKMGARRERTEVVRAGININLFNPTLKSTVRAKLGIQKDDIVLFFVGWLYHFAGLKEVIIRLAENKNPKIKLVVVGEGDAYSELKQIGDTYHLQNRLILTGQKPYQEVPAYIAAADICILPSYPWEPIMQDIVPIKLYDYMAMRKPVICTKMPGVMEEFGTENGMVFVDKPEDVLSEAIELLDQNKLDELGAKARQFAERNSWDKITDQFENILLKSIKKISK